MRKTELKSSATPMKRTATAKQRKAIKAVSDYRAIELKKYAKVRAEYLREHVICESCRNEWAMDVHHKAKRNGANLFRHLAAVCRSCHAKIHENPAWARANGWLITEDGRE